MNNWIIIDGKTGKKRLAKPNEILSHEIIDNSNLSIEDGDLVLPNYEVNENERSKNRKKNTQV
jgi:hypothetical protein